MRRLPEYSSRGLLTLQRTTVTIHPYVPNVDAALERAVAADASFIMPPADIHWGNGYGEVLAPFDQPWSINRDPPAGPDAETI